MSKSDSVFIVASGLCLILAFWAVSLSNDQYQCDRFYRYVYKDQKNFGGGLNSKLKCPPPLQNPDREEWRAEKDLQAQREMAKWSAWAIFLSAVGVVLIGGTLYYTARTLDEAKETTKAAQATISITEKNAQKQLRAYLMIESASAHRIALGEKYFVRITFRNFGQTPAHNVAVHMTIALRPKDFDEYLRPARFAKAAPRGAVGPTASTTITVSASFVLNEAMYKAIRKGEFVPYAYGSVRYHDTFENPQITRFRYAGVHFSEEDETVMAMGPSGLRYNNST